MCIAVCVYCTNACYVYVSRHGVINMQGYRTVIVYLAQIHQLNVVKITMKEIAQKRCTLVYFWNSSHLSGSVFLMLYSENYMYMYSNARGLLVFWFTDAPRAYRITSCVPTTAIVFTVTAL